MYIILLSIIGGIIALGFGAEMIVRSSVNLANIYKVSGYFIGFTVVALGTSLPELAATIQALSVVDSMEIALGNIIGSNIANILLILGVVSILQPIIFSEKKGQKNQTIMVLLITIIAAVIFYIVTNIPSSNPFILFSTSPFAVSNIIGILICFFISLVNSYPFWPGIITSKIIISNFKYCNFSFAFSAFIAVDTI